ncbi:MAG: copper-translocating P-type ATPase [Chitinophagaceae bacterium]|nr:copper-translocating P-type ATPase [Chitinophagaceae bacterium]
MQDYNSNHISLPLEGVDSEHCALIVDKGLNKVDGIVNHHVELNNKQAIIETNGDLAVLPQAVKAIRDLGYNVVTVKKHYPVLNMSCASCAASSQSILENQPGVVKAEVNYANASAAIEYIPGITDPGKLKSALQSVGYDLMTDESEESKDELENIQQKRLQTLKTKTIAAVLLSAPLMVTGMFFMDMPYANYIMWALATPVVLWIGRDFFVNAWKQLKHRSANMDTLVALSTGVAYIFSIFNTLFPEFWHKRDLHPHVYFEAAAVVIAFILLGKLLEEKAKNNTSSALKKLIGLQPKTVTVIHHGGHQAQVPLAEVKKGDIILVKPGEKIAVDGMVTSGSSYVDESLISGEPIPVEKKKESKVFAGTINQKGSLEFKAEKVGGDTLLAQIIQMVKDAQGSRAPVQKLVDKIAAIFVPIVIGIAVITFITWLVLGGHNGFTQGLMAMVTVLIIACPCALGLATPTAIMVGVGKGAANGILIKDAESLELSKNINVVVLDKTGTLTEGRPVVTDIYWMDEPGTHADILYSIEKKSEHPLAEAIVHHLREQKGVAVDKFENITGQGIKATVNDRTWLAGNKALMYQYGIDISLKVEQAAIQWETSARTVIYFSDEQTVKAIVGIADKIKPTSGQAVHQLKQNGIEVYMLTGDNEATAKAIAKEAGISHYKANVLPDQKLEFIQQLQQQGKTVAMVGDGVNDSAALAQSDVGIAMGKGSDIAIESAKMTIVSGDLAKVSEAIRLSRKTVSTIRQNLFWAFIYNIIGIPIAAGVLYPVNGFLLDPMIAGAAMALSSISVVSNSLRLKWSSL